MKRSIYDASAHAYTHTDAQVNSQPNGQPNGQLNAPIPTPARAYETIPQDLEDPGMDAEPEQKGFFNDVSLIAICASTLAALTSFVLSTQIGFTGSIIGVGVAAAASAFASQLCSSLLKASAHKIKRQQGKIFSTAPEYADYDRAAADKTTYLGRRHEGNSSKKAARNPKATRLAPYELRAKNFRKERTKRRILLGTVCGGVAILCVLIYAAVVNVATKGAGIGSKEVLAPIVQDQGHNASREHKKQTAPQAQAPTTSTKKEAENAQKDADVNAKNESAQTQEESLDAPVKDNVGTNDRNEKAPEKDDANAQKPKEQLKQETPEKPNNASVPQASSTKNEDTSSKN